MNETGYLSEKQLLDNANTGQPEPPQTPMSIAKLENMRNYAQKNEWLIAGGDSDYIDLTELCNLAIIGLKASINVPTKLEHLAQIPLGAIHNGETHIVRLETHYKFQCEAGELVNCEDWQGLKNCFRHLAETCTSSMEDPNAKEPGKNTS